MAWNFSNITNAANVAGFGQEQQPTASNMPELPALQSYQTSNPTQLSAMDARRAWANANGMQAQAEKAEDAPGGSLVSGPSQMKLAPAMEAAAPTPQNDRPAEQTPQGNMSSLGKAVGAVANFYTGNYAGAAQNVASMAKKQQDPTTLPEAHEQGPVSKPGTGTQAAQDLVGSLFGSILGGKGGGGQSGGASGGGSNMMSGIMSMFGGG